MSGPDYSAPQKMPTLGKGFGQHQSSETSLLSSAVSPEQAEKNRLFQESLVNTRNSLECNNGANAEFNRRIAYADGLRNQVAERIEAAQGALGKTHRVLDESGQVIVNGIADSAKQAAGTFISGMFGNNRFGQILRDSTNHAANQTVDQTRNAANSKISAQQKDHLALHGDNMLADLQNRRNGAATAFTDMNAQRASLEDQQTKFGVNKRGYNLGQAQQVKGTVDGARNALFDKEAHALNSANHYVNGARDYYRQAFGKEPPAFSTPAHQRPAYYTQPRN